MTNCEHSAITFLSDQLCSLGIRDKKWIYSEQLLLTMQFAEYSQHIRQIFAQRQLFRKGTLRHNTGDSVKQVTCMRQCRCYNLLFVDSSRETQSIFVVFLNVNWVTDVAVLMTVFLFYLMHYIPVNNCSVMSERVFLGWTSTKQWIRNVSRTHHSDSVGGEARTSNPSIPRLTLQTEPLHSTAVG